VAVFDEQLHSPAAAQSGPEALVLSSEDQQLVRQAVEELPVEFREVIVLRDLEGLSYKDIAHIAAIPIGTVMSRLARARQRLQQSLAQRMKKEP
jgi:RNA polymerase sigma-70 factor (ECF subfamily)